MRQIGTSRRRGFYTPKGKIARVRVRRIVGQTFRQIAEAENLSKNTVARILCQDETNEYIQAYQSAILTELVPLAVKGLKELLKKADRQAVIETLYGTKVFSQKHQVEGVTSHERDYSDAKIEFYYKFGRWPTLAEAKEYDKTIPVKPLLKNERSPQ